MDAKTDIDKNNGIGMENKRFIVTGGCGFIGSHLVEELSKLGAKVEIIDNLFSSKKNPSIINLPNTNFNNLSILGEKKVIRLIQDGDIICHLAAHFGHPRSLENPVLNFEVNVKGTLKLLELCRKKDIERLVFASTLTTYGDQEKIPIVEESAQHPKSLYDISKFCAEKYISGYNNLYGIKTTILRFANVYGPRDPYGKYRSAVSNFIYQILNNMQPTLHFEGKATRDFIYIKDIVQGLILAASKPKAVGEVFNVCTGIETKVKDLVNAIIKISNSNVKPKFVKSKEYYSSRLVGSVDKIRAKLGFEPKVNLKEGLKETIKWCLENKDEFFVEQPYSYF